MEIRTKEELKYIMEFYNIPYVSIKDGNFRMGKITKDMQYDTKYCDRYYIKEYEYMAFEKACEQISKDYDKIVSWKEASKRIFATHLIYENYDSRKERIENGYCWTSDFKKCHILVSKDEDGNMLLHGILNDLKNFRSYACDHTTYSRARYKFDNEELNDYIDLSIRYGLKNEGEDSYEWWRVGIVD